MEVRRVLQRKDGVKMVIVPKNSSIKKGELVLITKNLNLINKFQKEENNGRKRKGS
jgi:hypothetical protein